MEDFTIFYMDRISKKENQGRSFTRGACLRDYIEENDRNLDRIIREVKYMRDAVVYKDQIHPDVVEQFSVRTLLELLGNDELDEICNYLYFNNEE